MKFKIWKGSKEDWDNHLLSSGNHSMHQTFLWGEYIKNSNWKVYRLIEPGHKSERLNFTILIRYLPFGFAVAWCQGLNFRNHEIIRDNLQKEIKEALNIKFVYLRIKFLFNENYLIKNLLMENDWKECTTTLSSNETLSFDFQKDVLLSKNWSKNLRRFNRKKLNIYRWNNPNPNKIFNLYRKLENFKKIKKQFSLHQIKSLINIFQDDLMVYVCENDKKKIISLRAIIINKQLAYDIFSISTFEGRKYYAGYGLLWRIYQECKNLNIKFYDLGGVDRINNKTVYNFKKGTGASNINYVGEFSWSNFPLMRDFTDFLIKVMIKWS